MSSTTPRFAAIVLIPLLGACFRIGGSGNGGGPPPPPPAIDPPTLDANDVARFYDLDGDGLAGAGDRLVIPFDAPVRVRSNSVASLVLPTTGDAFGSNARIVEGPAANEISVVLGSGAVLKSRQRFVARSSEPHPPSGVGVADDIARDAIENALTGDDAIPGATLDIVPAYVEGSALVLDPTPCLATGDFDRNGRPDFLSAREAGGVQVALGSGTGEFSLPGTFGARRVVAIEVADFDRDAFQDVVLVVDDGLEVWRGEGAGQFGLTTERLALGTVMDAVAVDLERDGDTDIVYAGSNGVGLLLNQGDGSFSDPIAVQEPIQASTLEAGDIDGDGRPELLVASTEGVVVLDAPPGGNYTQSAMVGNTVALALALADLDRNGTLDCIAVGLKAQAVWLGDGAGGFEESGVDLGTAVGRSVAAIDVDSDGMLDLVLGAEPKLRVLFQTSEGAFVDSKQAFATTSVRALAAADYDRDGDVDLLLANQLNGPVLARNSLAGTWGGVGYRERGSIVSTGVSHSAEAADVDRDGDLDLLIGQNRRLLLARGLGTGAFAAPEVLFETDDTRVNDIAAGDVDNDGDVDLVLGLQGAGLLVWLNDGQGNFDPYPQAQEPGMFTKAVELGDIDGDGDLDLIQGNMDQQADVVRRNLGQQGEKTSGLPGWSGFDAPVPLLENGLPIRVHTGDVRLADLDRDGDLDLICGYGPFKENRWFRNDGLGDFSIQDQLLGMVDCRSITIGDIDRDGDPDVVTGTAIGERELLNNGQGTFSIFDELSVSNTFKVQLIDLTGDGAAELLIGNGQEQGLGVWLNDGNGRYGTTPWLRLHHRSVRTALGVDLDHDGDIDLISTNLEDDTLRVWLNR